MDFVILDENLENTLKKVLEYTVNGVAEEVSLSGAQFDDKAVESLAEKGFLKGTKHIPTYWDTRYSVTYEGRHYFDLKKKFLEQQSKEKQKDNRRFWITTGISIGAVIVSIIALVVSIIK